MNERKRFDSWPPQVLVRQYQRLSRDIQSRIEAIHPQQAEDLAAYTRAFSKSMREVHRSADFEQRRQWGIDAGVWMVEALIVLQNLRERGIEPALAGAADEILERIDEALRADGALPPARS